MKKLIITADDYGMCESVNKAIELCAENRIVLSTNVMVNMECAEEAASLKKKYPYLSVGIHYNLTVGQPVSDMDYVRSLVDEDGQFLSSKEIRRKCKEGTYQFQEVEREIRAQYYRYKEICGEPDYWNTHEHIHVSSKLYRLFRDESIKCNIMKMRSNQRIFVPAKSGGTDKKLSWLVSEPIKEVILNSWQAESKKLGVSSPDGLLFRMDERDKLDLDYLFGHIKWGRHDNVELAIHPSLDGNCTYFGAITDLRVKEFELFSNTEIIALAQKKGIELVGFDYIQKR